MLSAFELIEQTFKAGPWVLGTDFSIADAYLYTFARWLEMDRVDTRGLKRVLAPSSSNGAAASGPSRFGRRGDSL